MSILIIIFLSFLIQWLPMPEEVRTLGSVFLFILMIICGIVEIKHAIDKRKDK